jgi:hypothetical protein
MTFETDSKSFGRLAIGDGKHLKQVSFGSRKPLQSGVWDTEILCQRCDGILGIYDKYAIELVRRAASEIVLLPDESFELGAVETALIVKFVAAVLWRASITRHPEFSEVRLGPYEPRYRDLLFGGENNFSANCAPEVILFRYLSPTLRVDGFYTMPIWSALQGGINCYIFALAGFRIIAKVDQRPFPPLYRPYVINGKDRISGLFAPFEETTEYDALREIVAERLAPRRSV